jgi:phage gpG-like protein
MTIDLTGVDVIQRRLGKLGDLARYPMPILEAAGQVVNDDGIRKAFNQQEAPDGTPWKPLAPSTLESTIPGTKTLRKDKSPPARPLIRTGVLRNSFTVQRKGRSVSVGTPFAFAKYHSPAPGAPMGKGILPERQFFPWPTSGRFPRHIQTGIAEALDELIEATQRA